MKSWWCQDRPLLYLHAADHDHLLYHGTLEVVANGKGKSKIRYNLIWDLTSDGTDEAKAKDRDGRAKRFTEALASM